MNVIILLKYPTYRVGQHGEEHGVIMILSFHLSMKKKNPYFIDNAVNSYWHFIFHNTKRKINTCDCQWVYTIFRKNRLCIAPQYNLVSNIGFSKEVSHEMNEADYLRSLKTYEMTDYSLAYGICDYQLIDDINEQLFFNLYIKEDASSNISALQAFKIIKAKVLLKLKILKLKVKF